MNNIDFKRYYDDKKSYRRIRTISDEICKEHNLSVIKENRYKSKSYKEWLADKQGKSWKTQLRQDINECIKQSHVYADFIRLMMAKGYELKDSDLGETAHKYISFRAPGYTRWVRGKAQTLGAEYTKERIRQRIENKPKIRTEKMLKNSVQSTAMIDTSQEKFRDNDGLMRWAKRQNLKAAARIQSLLAEMKLDNYEALNERINELHRQAKTGRKASVAMDREITEFENLLHYARMYNDNKKYLQAYSKSKDPDRYYRTHGDQIEMATGALHHLKNAGLDPERIDLQQMESDYTKMTADRAKTRETYKTAEHEEENLKKLRDDLMSYINAPQPPEKEPERKHSL